ncbi:MAG TPA: methylenetetrahydrofolate reductase [Candidatus Limnocylindrales bacterium]
MPRRLADLPSDQRAAIVALLRAPTFELIPLKNAHEQAAFLPDGSLVSVTASPAKGIEATVELAEQLASVGHRPVVHLSARMIRDRAHLRALLDRLAAGGLDRAFVVGGDADVPGEFRDALSLLRAMAEMGHALREIGIGCYPDGHPDIPDDALVGALHAKAPYASYMTTQMCFDPRKIGGFIAARRSEGIALPVHLGLPGVAEVAKLALISARIGVKDSKRFMRKNVRLVGQLVRPGGYRPDGLLESLGDVLADPTARVDDLHVYTFNQVETTEEWRRGYLRALREEDQA